MSEKNYFLKNFAIVFYILKFISKVEFFCLLILLYILVLLIGTIEQKNFGLQFAQDTYFNSNLIIFFNTIPMLGGKLILILIFINLTARLIIDKWNTKRIGTILLHIGILFLLFGAFVSNKVKIEGHLIIKEHNYNNSFERNDIYNLIFFNKETNNGFNCFNNINSKNEKVLFDKNSFLNITSFNSNCKLVKKKRFITKSKIDGIGRFFSVVKFPSFVEQEENRLFLLFDLVSLDNKRTFCIVGYNSNFLTYENNFIKINLYPKNEKLPFNIYLSKFDKITYNGTAKAKDYVSNLIIESNNISWKTKIAMNKPLRIENYTLYQTSFLDGKEKSTVLTVVENTLGFYPYISTFLIFLGFFVHLFISFKRIRAKNE